MASLKKTLALIAALLLIPGVVGATPSSVDRITDHIEPLIKTDYIKGDHFVATSTITASVLPVLNGTSITGFSLTTCVGNNFLQWSGGLFGCAAAGGGGAGTGTVSTSTPLVAGQVDFSTGVSTIGNDSTFTFDTTSKVLGVTSLLATGSTTLQNFTGLKSTTTNATSTTFAISSILSKLLKTNSTGGVIPAIGDTDYQNPITLTTTGSSGVATFIADTLNIPNYGAGSFASSTLLGDNNRFTGNNVFTQLITGSVSGNAGTATTLATGRTISITGDLAYTSPSFDGSGNVTAAGTLATVNGNVGSFGGVNSIPNFTVNGKGLITAAGANTPSIPASEITSGTFGTGDYTFPANLTVTSLLTSANILATGSSTFQNFTFVNATGSAATTTNLSISNNASTTNLYINQAVGCLQVNAAGKVVSTGVNCSTGGSGDPYPFQGAGNSTSTLVQFNAGLTAYNASSTITNLTVTTSTTTNAILQGVTGLNTVENIITTGTGNTGEIRFTPAGVASTGFVFKRYGSAIGSGLNNTGELWNFESTGNSGIRFGGSGGEAMRVDTINARVGIGTVSPQTALDVQGTASATNATTTTFFGAGLTNCNSASNALTWTTTGKFGCNSITGGSGDPYPFKGTGNSTSTLTQFNAGLTAYATSTIGDGSVSGGLTISGNSTTTGIAKIGLGNGTIIGTNGQLVVNQNGAAGLIVHNSTAGNEYGAFAGTNGHASAGATTNNQFRLLANNTPQVYIDPGNFVGIGTSTPVWQLNLATSTRPQLALSDGIITDNHWTLRSVGNNLYFATASPATYATSSVSALTIDTNGFPTWPALKGVGCAQFDANGKETNTGIACGTGGGSTNTDKFATSTNNTTIFPNAGLSTRLGVGTTSALAMLDIYSNGTTMPFRVSSSTSPFQSYLEVELNGNVGVGTSTAPSAFTVSTSTFSNAAFPVGILIGQSGLTSGSANGTISGINTQAGFTGDLFNYQVGGTSEFIGSSAGTLTANGNLIAAAGGNLQLNGRSIITSASDGVTELSNNANTDFTRLQFGGTSTAFPALLRTGNALALNLADGTAGGRFATGTTTPGLYFLAEFASATPFIDIMDNDGGTDAKHGIIGFNGGKFTFGTSSDSLNGTSTAMTLDPSPAAQLGVGTTSPWRTLSVTGTVGFDGLVSSASASNFNVCITPDKQLVNSGGSTCTASSMFIKHGINTVTTASSTNDIMNLRPVSYTENTSGLQLYGFIAEEVEKIDPLLVEHMAATTTIDGHTFNTGDPYNVDYPRVVPGIVKYLQDHPIAAAKRSVEENWQWLAIAILGSMILWQGRAIRKLQKGHNTDMIEQLKNMSVEEKNAFVASLSIQEKDNLLKELNLSALVKKD